MKFIIEEVTYISGDNPTIAILWSSGTTHFYAWTNYPAPANLAQFKPWSYQNTSGITLFRAPIEMTQEHIFTENIRNYQAEPEDDSSPDLVSRLEAIAEKVLTVSQNRCLYFSKNNSENNNCENSSMDKPTDGMIANGSL